MNIQHGEQGTTINTDRATLFLFDKNPDPSNGDPAVMSCKNSMFWEKGNNKYYDGPSRVMYILELLTFLRTFLVDSLLLGANSKFQVCTDLSSVTFHNLLPIITAEERPMLMKSIKKSGDTVVNIEDNQLYILINQDPANNTMIFTNAPDFDVYFGLCQFYEQIIRNMETERYPKVQLFMPAARDSYSMDKYKKAVEDYFTEEFIFCFAKD